MLYSKNRYTMAAFAVLAIVVATFSVVAYQGSAIAGDGPMIDSTLVTWLESGMAFLVSSLAAVLFYKVFEIPILVLWLIIGGVFFTIRLGFINIRLFAHAIQVVRGKYSSGKEPGEVSHFQALVAAVSATVGLGNIAGVAVAVTIGGPGAVVWMALAGIFGMSTKFAEVTLGQKYRKIDKNGKVSGGAFHYLKDGLAEKNMPQLGKVLAMIFAFLCVMGSLGGGNMFQSNQTVSIMTDSFGGLKDLDWVIALVLAVAVGTVLIGGIKRIALVAEAIVPLMAFVYITAAIVVMVVNSDKLADSFIFMFQDAFSGVALGGGLMGALIAGFKRAAFSNEAGLGSAPIAHAAAKTSEPVREGCVALLEPFLDTVVICFITGIVITITGVYQEGQGVEGVMLTSRAFSTVIDWFPIVLTVAVTLFAYSTMITWSYYGERAWQYMFGASTVSIFHVIFCTCTFVGGVMNNLGLIVDFSDLLLLSMAIPNMIGLYIMSNTIKSELDTYISKLKAGKFKVYNKKTTSAKNKEFAKA